MQTFYSMIELIHGQKVIEKIGPKKFDYADLFFENSQKLGIVLEDKKVDSVTSICDQGMALRGIKDCKTSFASSNVINKSELLRLCDIICVNQAKVASAKIVTASSNPLQSDVKRLVALLGQAEKRAWNQNSQIVQVSLRYSEHRRYSELLSATSGLSQFENYQVMVSLSVTLSRNGELFRGYDSMGGTKSELQVTEESLSHLVDQACMRAKLNSEAPKIKGGVMSVIIAGTAGGTLVHEAIGHGLEADLVYEGMSVFEGKMGQAISSPLVNVVDDPTLSGMRGSFGVDDEGLPSERTQLIKDGILTNYLFDRLTALKHNQKPNGHGRRENFRFKPIARMSNTLMLPGQENPESIIRSVSDGLLVKMMGGGQVDTITGDFVFEVTEGYLIKNGKIEHPVKGATIGGNAPKVLMSIDKVGADIGFSVGTCGKDGQEVPVTDGMPTIRVPEMIVGGTA